MAHRKSASKSNPTAESAPRPTGGHFAATAERMDFAGNPQPMTFTSHEQFASTFRTELQLVLEDEDFVARMAVALLPHFPGNGKRAKGRPSLMRHGGDHDETDSIVAQAKVHVLDKMECCTVRSSPFPF